MGEGHVAAGGIAAAARGAWLVFEDEAVFSMTQLTRRTWARRGRTPVVRVPGRPSTTFGRRRGLLPARAALPADLPSPSRRSPGRTQEL